MVTICAWCSSLLPTAKMTSSCGEMQHDPLLSRSNPYYSASRFKFYAYNKSLCKWGHFEKAKTTFKMLLATWFLVCLFKRFRFFNAKNLGSAGQRAAKLLAVKVGGLKKGLPAGPGPSQPVCPGSMPGRSQIILKVWWLVTLQPFNLQTPNFHH